VAELVPGESLKGPLPLESIAGTSLDSESVEKELQNHILGNQPFFQCLHEQAVQTLNECGEGAITDLLGNALSKASAASKHLSLQPPEIAHADENQLNALPSTPFPPARQWAW
jgi:hypothetical protein